jgi:hypothetical protein
MTDKQRFLIYFAVRLATLLIIAAGLYAIRADHREVGVGLMVLGAAGFFIRPRHILPGR